MEREKIIVIGDVHGEDIWKEIVNKHPGEKLIFLGDYCDPYNKELSENDVIENLKKIILLKKKNPENVTLLLGNHDIQYIYDEAFHCSRYMYSASIRLSRVFKENIALFEKVHYFKKILFTHAGITKEWLLTSFDNIQNIDVVQAINESQDTKALFACGIARWGPELYGGIFWADRREFENPLEGWIQVAGHSRVPEITVKHGENGGIIVFCDSLWNGNYLIIEDNQEEYSFYTSSISEERTLQIMSVSKKHIF